MTTQFTDLDKERLELLSGTRRADKSQSAVRRADLISLVKLAPTQVVEEAGSTVTVAHFNTLVDEYLALRQAIDQIVAIVKPSP